MPKTIEAIASVLQKLGIEPSDRIGEFDQDPEYTACRVEELERYLSLYRSGAATTEEREVLAGFMFECLNDHWLRGYRTFPATRDLANAAEQR